MEANKIELEDIDFEEIEPFFNSLSEEYRYFRFAPKQLINTSVFVKGVRVDNTLAGLGGLTKSYGYFFFSFHVVKTEFQRRGLHSKITMSLVEFTKRKKRCLFLAQVDKENIASLNAGLKEGYKVLYDEGDKYWIYFPVSKLGEILGKYCLPLLLTTYLVTIGKLLRRRQTERG